nr:hypothetical protein Iba_chr07cCG7280 [Ipomoea batatas]
MFSEGSSSSEHPIKMPISHRHLMSPVPHGAMNYLEERRTDWEVQTVQNIMEVTCIQPYGSHPKYPFAQIFIAQVQELARRVKLDILKDMQNHSLKIYEQHMESIMFEKKYYPEYRDTFFAQKQGQRKERTFGHKDLVTLMIVDSVLEEVEKIEKGLMLRSPERKRPEDKSQWNKDVWRTKRRQSRMDSKNGLTTWVTPATPAYSTESDTASDEDSVMDLQFRGEWMIMKASQPGWDSQSWKGKRFMKEG